MTVSDFLQCTRTCWRQSNENNFPQKWWNLLQKHEVRCLTAFWKAQAWCGEDSPPGYKREGLTYQERRTAQGCRASCWKAEAPAPNRQTPEASLLGRLLINTQHSSWQMWIIGRLNLIGFLCAVTYTVPSTKPDQRQKCAFLLQATVDSKAGVRNSRNTTCKRVKSLLRIQYFWQRGCLLCLAHVSGTFLINGESF